jgi:hypothetical protein
MLKRHVVGSTLRNVVGVLVGLLLALLSLGLVASILSAPIDVAWRTWDMVRMRCVAEARIDQVGLRESPGWALAAPDVSYSFRVAGKQYRSRRLLPGFLPNHTVWSTGDAAVCNYRPGDQVLIHYDPADPQRSWLRSQRGRRARSFGVKGVYFPKFVQGAAKNARGKSLMLFRYQLHHGLRRKGYGPA